MNTSWIQLKQLVVFAHKRTNVLFINSLPETQMITANPIKIFDCISCNIFSLIFNYFRRHRELIVSVMCFYLFQWKSDYCVLQKPILIVVSQIYVCTLYKPTKNILVLNDYTHICATTARNNFLFVYIRIKFLMLDYPITSPLSFLSIVISPVQLN